jgi:heme/copper-type cytochrome/quinol oxidase subunit 2
MDYVTARLIVLPTVAIGSAWLVARYKAKGGVVAVLLGWVILGSVYNAWPAPPPEWDEDREEIWMTAPILMTIWCTLIWTVLAIRAWVNRRGKWGPWPTKPNRPS